MTTQYQIKSNGWHNVTLNGNILTGDTFKARDFIKNNLRGKWDGTRKGWIVDLDAVKKYTVEGTNTLMIR